MVLFMDSYNTEPRMGSATLDKASVAVPPQEAVRPPLLPSERNNAKKSQPREIASRCRFGTNPATAAVSSRKTSAVPRLPSPSPAAVSERVCPVPGQTRQKRAQSAERRPAQAPAKIPAPAASQRRSAPSSPSSSRTSTTTSSPSSTRSTTPVRDSSSADVHASSKRAVAPPRRSVDGLWPSMRSLSSSLNSEPTSPLSVNKDKIPTATQIAAAPAPKPSLTSTDPHKDRKRTPLRGRNPSDQSENAGPVEVPLSRNTNTPTKGVDPQRWPGRGAMMRSVDLTPCLPAVPTRGLSPNRTVPSSDDASGRILLSRSTSDGSRRLSLDGSRRMSLDGTRRSETPIASIFPAYSKPLPPPLDRPSSATPPNRNPSMPVPTNIPPPSLSKQTFPSHPLPVRGTPSPSRARPSTPVSSSASSAVSRSVVPSSLLNYIAAAKKVKKHATHLEDVHQLRLSYNRCLQWRFVNARADVAHSNQKTIAENVLHSTYIGTLELRKSVLLRRVSIQKQRQELKLKTILREQIAYLEDWALLEREHSSSLSEAIEALKASTIRLPVTGGAIACFHDISNAIHSALDVMQAIGSSICDILSRVEETGSVVLELAKVAANERAMINDCRALLALTAALQVQESSLQTHLLQLNGNKMQLS